MQDLPRCRARAAELFDWLRQLPETHELAHLCDVYTYTTAISHVRTPNTVQYCTSELCKWRARVQAKNRAHVQAHHQWQSICGRGASLAQSGSGGGLRRGCFCLHRRCGAAQCGSHQQLRKALEMIAEMRSRGIPRNVHTFSALMNVCIKARRPRGPALACRHSRGHM
jgi:pentatricopeptide repeat protein